MPLRYPWAALTTVMLSSYLCMSLQAVTPFDFPVPQEPVLSVTLSLCSEDQEERQNLLYINSESDIGVTGIGDDGGFSFKIFLDEQSTFYGCLSDLGGLFSHHLEIGWLVLKVEGRESRLFLTDLFKKEEKIIERLFFLNRALFGEIPPMKQKWRQAIRSVISRLKRKKEAQDYFSLVQGQGRDGGSLRGNSERAEMEIFGERDDSNAQVTHQPRRRRSIFQGSSFWTKFLDDAQDNKPCFYLDQTRADPDKWCHFHAIDIEGIDYKIVQVMMPLFQNTQYFRVNNLDIDPLLEAVQLRFSNYNRILHIDLSFDANLFVHDYSCIVNNYSGSNYVNARRKVISGPLYSVRVDEHTFIPAVAHPLISDATGTSGVLPLRTQKIFSSIPTAGSNIKIEFYGANFVTGIDFAERPVTSAILESLFQPNITTTFDPMATWDDRLGWASKFMTMRYLDLSRTNINDLNVLQNFKQLQTLVVRDMTFLEVKNVRFLPHLQVIESELINSTWFARVQANWAFIRLSLYNFIGIKHDFYPIILFCFGIAVWALRSVIRAVIDSQITA
jgi:hypothetical protein